MSLFESFGDPPEPKLTENDKWHSLDCLQNEHAECDGIAIAGHECGCTCHDGFDEDDGDGVK